MCIRDRVYRGIPVYGRKVTVSADADSEAALLTSGFYPIENLSVEAKITQNMKDMIYLKRTLQPK